MSEVEEVVRNARRILVLFPGLGKGAACELAAKLSQADMAWRIAEVEQPWEADPVHCFYILVRSVFDIPDGGLVSAAMASMDAL